MDLKNIKEIKIYWNEGKIKGLVYWILDILEIKWKIGNDEYDDWWEE